MLWLPKYVKNDGTFCVVVKFNLTANTPTLSGQIDDWCKLWIDKHKTWHPTWLDDDPPIIGKGDWEYFEIFIRSPYVIKAESDQLWIRFDGKKYSYWWRDWLIRLITDLKRDFPQLQDQLGSFNYDECL